MARKQCRLRPTRHRAGGSQSQRSSQHHAVVRRPLPAISAPAKRTVSPLEALFGSRSGLFEDFLGSDFFRIGDDATPVAADTDDVVDASFGEPADAGSVLRRRGSGLASRISEQSEALLQEAAKHAAEFGRSEVDTEHLLLALADSDVVKTIPVSSRSRSMTSSGRSSLRPSAGTSPSRARSACRRA